MAELEAEAGAPATYFLMTRSVFYNLSSPEGERALERLRELGHRVGLHAVWPDVDLDERFDPVLAWHNPDPEYMREPVEGAINVMESPWFDPEPYRSDSNQHWRCGCPHEELRAGEFPWLQLLTHPEIWVYPGATMGETMRAMLDAERERGSSSSPTTGSTSREGRHRPRLRLRRARHRGAPAALRANGEREVRLVGTDMSERSVGRHLCDAFHLVPAGSDPGFADAMLAIVEREGVDVVLPQSSFDLEGLAAHRDRFPVPVLVSSPDTIRRSNDKAETYALLHRLGVQGPDFRRVNGAAEVEAAAAELGYPDRPVCFKPVFSSGSRGFRILDPTVDRAHQLLHERPGSVAMRLEEAVELLPDEGGPDLLVMELATGGERTIDGIADGKRVVLGHPKTREAMRAGLAMYFVTLDDEELMAIADSIVRSSRSSASSTSSSSAST